jgi:hypothetical protein
LVGEVGRVSLSHAVERTRSPRTLSLTKHALSDSFLLVPTSFFAIYVTT